MEIAIWLVGLAVVVLAGTALSERLRLSAPLLLVLIGVVGSYLPFAPSVHLNPEVVLVGLLPPLLYATAIQTSLVDFTRNVRSILLLSVALVVVTTAAVGGIVVALLPGVGWPVALAIGAVVAPTDAVAATAVARRIGMPRRLVTILEGESLINDATALVALRTAIVAIGAGVTVSGIGLDFLVAAGGGVGVGLVCFWLVAWLRRKVTDALLDTAFSFVIPFAAYIAAEEIHASGVIAVVVAGLLLGHKAPLIQTATSRITERITWRTVAFMLENTVFLLIGLQAKWILEDVVSSDVGGWRVLAVCAAVLVGVIVVRLAWVLPLRSLLTGGRRLEPLQWSETFLLGWAGMRGVVTLAAAFVIPLGTPFRDVLLLIAFAVVAGTLFVQGLSLPWLTRRLRVPAPDPASDALARATVMQQAAKAGLARLDAVDHDDPHGVVDQIRARMEQRTFAAWERLSTTVGVEAPSQSYARIRLDMIGAERARVLEIRREGRVPSEIVSEVLGMLDIEESMVDVGSQARTGIRTTSRVESEQECAELRTHPVVEPVGSPRCASCDQEGLVPVALRQCLDCGNVGCCDSSVGQHATAHFRQTLHPVMQSAEPDESWRWCYLHERTA